MPNPGHTPNHHPSGPLTGESLWPIHKPLLGELIAHADAVFKEMVENRDIAWDDRGEPIAELLDCGQTSDCTWCYFEVDISAIGMPTDSPIVVSSYEGDNFVTWSLGDELIALIPKGKSAKETAESLGMDPLLDAFRRFVIAESRK